MKSCLKWKWLHFMSSLNLFLDYFWHRRFETTNSSAGVSIFFEKIIFIIVVNKQKLVFDSFKHL
jgi:hypothetical protein